MSTPTQPNPSGPNPIGCGKPGLPDCPPQPAIPWSPDKEMTPKDRPEASAYSYNEMLAYGTAQYEKGKREA